MPKVPNVGKVAKRQIASPALASKKLLTCMFTLLKMHPSNELQLFRHFPIEQAEDSHARRQKPLVAATSGARASESTSPS